MKGLSVDYVAYAVIFVVVVLVGIQLIKNFSKPPQIKTPRYNATYNCLRLNDTEIDKTDLKDIIYGFLNEQCKSFYATSLQRITAADVERLVHSLNKEIKFIRIQACEFPPVNSGNFYINFDVIERGEKIYLNRKNIINSDIIMCVV